MRASEKHRNRKSALGKTKKKRADKVEKIASKTELKGEEKVRHCRKNECWKGRAGVLPPIISPRQPVEQETGQH